MKFNFSEARSGAVASLLWLTGLFGPTPALAVTKTTLSQGTTDSETSFVNRRALVGHSCMVTSTGNGLAQVVNIPDSVENICDENLNNTAIFTKVVETGVADQQLVGVKDIEHYYKAGTEAGFLVTSSKTKLLGADVADMFTIQFYRDGKLVETKKVTAGQDASVLSVSLIQIGNKDACQEYTATSSVDFDEIRLAQVGVLSLDVVGSLGIKYAFVGKAKEYTITQSSMEEYAKYVGRTAFDVKGCNTTALPIPNWSISNDMVDNDTTNTTAILAVAAIGSSLHPGVRALPATNNTEGDYSDVFKKGTTIGFKYVDYHTAKIDIATSIYIDLYDHNGDKVETHRISTDVLGLGLIGKRTGKYAVVAGKDFSRADIYVAGVASVDIGYTSAYYAYVVLPPTVQEADDSDNDLVLKEEEKLAETTDHSSARLIFRRSFNENAWNSLILPVDLSKDEFEEAFGSDAKLSEFSSVKTSDNTTTLSFSQVNSETNDVFLAKNTPYIIYLPDGNDKLHPETALYQTLDGESVSGPLYIVETGVDFEANDVTPKKVTTNEVTFTGSYDAEQSLTSGWYVFNKGNLYHTTKAHTQKAYRCWIEYTPTSDAKETVLSGFGVDDNGTTAIHKVLTDCATAVGDGRVYNLRGQQIDSSAKLQPGIYLMGNKKFVVK